MHRSTSHSAQKPKHVLSSRGHWSFERAGRNATLAGSSLLQHIECGDIGAWEGKAAFMTLSSSEEEDRVCVIYTLLNKLFDVLKVFRFFILSRVFMSNNAGSGLDEQVYSFLIRTTSNYT